MAKARRKMRRSLMKKMKKGSLTPGERRDLMELDREVNRANRQAAGIGGAGLATALAIASKTGALEKGKDALGEFLDTRKARKDGQEIADAKLDMEMMRLEDLKDGLPKDSPDPSKRDKKKRMKAAEEAALLGLNIEDEEDFVDEELDADLKKYREGRMKDLEQAIESNAALASMFGRGEAPPPASSIRPVGPGPKYDAGEGTAFDDLPKSTDYMTDEPLGPFNEQAFRPEGIIRNAREAGPRANEGVDGPVTTRQGMDLDTMIRMGGRGVSEGDRGAGPAAELSDYSPEEIEALIRYDLRQAQGGTTPFLRKMRDRIRKKFR